MARDEKTQPNIILITTDQQRYDTVPPNAPSFMRTPHFEFLAREGVVFDRAYAESPVCVPSRVSIMTGQSALTHGMLGNEPTSDYINEPTLPTVLGEAGYQTMAIGKMHFGPQRARHGFQEVILPDDYYREMERSGSPVQPMRHGLGQNELQPAMATVPEAMTLTSWIADRCADFIHYRRDPMRPFFLWCSFTKPHPPFDPPEPYYSMYRGADIPDPVHGDWSEALSDMPPDFRARQLKQDLHLLSEEVIREARAAYYGLVTQCDYAMGRVFSALQDEGLLDDALIVFTSDHGEYLGDHRAGAKLYFHEVSSRVPLVVRCPKSWGDRPSGVQLDSLVTHADIMATLVAAAGADPPESDGIDLLRLARSETSERESLVGACWWTFGHDKVGYFALVTGAWKYIWYPDGSHEQLFHLAEDPLEQRNLAHSPEHHQTKDMLHAALLARLRSRWPDYLEDGALPRRPEPPFSDTEIRSTGWPGFHSEVHAADVRH
jgi:arylsulfatase